MRRIRLFLNTFQYANLGTLLLNLYGQLPEPIQGNKWVIAAHAVIAALLPSLHGAGHRLFFRTPQIPGGK